MARISVEQKALTDSRFTQLGMSLVPDGLAVPGYFMHALGLGVMIYVWNECQERSTHSLHFMDLEAMGLHLGLNGVKLSASIVTSELGRWDKKNTRVRIRGTKGRIEWVQKLKESNKTRQREHRQRNALVTRDNPGALTPALALALSPSEVLSEKTTTTVRPRRSDAVRVLSETPTKPSPLVNGERTKILQENFGTLYGFYPRHVGKAAAWKAFVRLDPDGETLHEIAVDVKRRTDSGEWIPSDPERVQFIPHLGTYLNQRRWTDEE